MTKVLITCIQMSQALDVFGPEMAAMGWEVCAPEVTGQQFSEDELIEHLAGVAGVIAGDDPFSARVLEAAPHLRAISKWGIGIDGIDSAAAQRLGIAVSRTPDVFGDEVADVALGFVIGLARNLFLVDRSIREGVWAKPRGLSLRGRRAVVVGLGDIGRSIAARLRVCGVEVVAVDPAESAKATAESLGITLAELDEVAGQADFLILACPLTTSTRGLVDASLLATLPNSGFVVNVARGPVIVEADLIEALRTGAIAGAALDVFESEPVARDNPLVGMDNVILGSHNASNSDDAVLRASRKALNNLVEMLEVTS